MADVADPCAECGGSCCSFQSMTMVFAGLGEGERYDSKMIEYDCEDLLFEDGTVPDMEWYVFTYPNGRRCLAFDCGHLEDGMCSEYDRRPEMCRRYECEVLRGETDLDEFLETNSWGSDGLPALEDIDKKNVTDRVREIIAREADA